MKIVAAAWIAILGSSAHAADVPRASELIRKSREALAGPHEQSTYAIRLLDPQGQPDGERRVQVWMKSSPTGATKILARIQDPADLRDTQFLSLLQPQASPEQWILMPAAHKARRIRGGAQNDAFLGNDLSITDLIIARSGPSEDTVIGEEKCGDSRCHLVKVRSTSDGTERTLAIRADNFLNVRTDYRDGEGKLVKRMTLEAFHRDAATGRWVADRIRLRNLVTNRAALITPEKRDTRAAPADSLFTRQHLESGSR